MRKRLCNPFFICPYVLSHPEVGQEVLVCEMGAGKQVPKHFPSFPPLVLHYLVVARQGEKLPWARNPRLVIVTAGVCCFALTESIQWPLLTAIHSNQLQNLKCLVTTERLSSQGCDVAALKFMQCILLKAKHFASDFLFCLPSRF